MNRYTLAGVATITLLLFFISCTDEPIRVDTSLLPQGEMLNAETDTFAVECYTIKGAPYFAVFTESASDNCPIGQVIDPVFGKTEIDLAMQVSITDTSNYYGKDSIVDSDKFISCKLYLKVNDKRSYGGANGFNVDVYKLLKKMDYSQLTDYVIESDNFDFENNLATSTHHRVYIDHKKIYGIDSGNYYLVVDLDDDFSSLLMDTNIIKENDIYNSPTDFTNYLKGFYIRSNALTPVGGIENFYFKNSKMVLEFERTLQNKDGGDSVVTRYISHYITKYQCFYRHESNNYPGGPLSPMMQDTINQYEHFYVQSMGGSNGYIKMPVLNQLKKTKRDSMGIHLAELILPIDGSNVDTTQFILPYRLTLMDITRERPQGDVIVDDAYFNYNYFLGYYNKSENEYRINLTEYVHQYLKTDSTSSIGKTSTGSLILLGAVNSASKGSLYEYKVPGRVILNSGLGNKPAMLRIVYTKTTY